MAKSTHPTGGRNVEDGLDSLAEEKEEILERETFCSTSKKETNKTAHRERKNVRG